MITGTSTLPFESEALELEGEADELERLGKGDVDFSHEVARLREKARRLRQKGLAKLDRLQLLQLARHPLRPTAGDLLALLIDKGAVVDVGQDPRGTKSALGELAGRPVVILAYDSGEGGEAPPAAGAEADSLRVAQGAVALSGRLGRPLVTLIGRSPAGGGVEVAVEVGRLALALADSTSPSVAVLTSGATGPLPYVLMIADEVLMMRHSALGSFAPEQVRAELFDEDTPLLAVVEALILDADAARERGFVDRVVDEPEGGAHRDPQRAGELLRGALDEVLRRVSTLDETERLTRRAARAKEPRGYKER